MALTYEQFKKAKESGLSTEQIAQFEQRRTKESQVGQKIQTQTEQPSGVLSNVLGAGKAVGGFLGGLAKDMTKPVVSSAVSPIQLAKTAKNYYGDEDVQKRTSEAMRGIDPDKKLKESTKHTDNLLKALKTAETDEEKASIAKLMQEDINKYVKGVQEKPIKEEVDTSVTLPFYGEIEAPKTAKEVAGRAIETTALGVGGTGKAVATTGKSLFKRALTGPGSKIGATYGAGSALSENKSLGETALQAGIGGLLGGATDLALIGGGKGLQKLGEKLQKPTAETKLSLGEKASSSIINSLIKPLKKDFAYGKNPGLSVAREKITANSWDDLVAKIGKAKTKTGKEIGSFYKDNVDGKTTVNLSNSLKSIDETIKKAASENNQSVINRLEDVKNAITKKLVPAKDEAGKTIIKTAGKKRLYNIKPSNAQSIIEKIGEMTKFTGNVSDDNMVNKALKKVYGSARNELESSIKKVDESLYSKIRQLNEHYGNITSADIAAKNREMIVQRANLMGLAPEVISGTSIVGGLVSGNPIAIIGGIMTAMGNQAMKSPAIKTRLASILAGASNKERISIFAKYPALKSLKENIGVGISKTGEVISKIPGIAEEAPRKSVQSLMEAARTKMPIGMTVKDVSKEGFSKAGVPQKLTEEARKYKSAEEFIKAQGTPVYRGQDSAKFSMEGKSAGIGKSFTTDKKIAEVYGSKGKIIDGFIDNKDVLRYNELDSKTKQYIKSIIDERIDRVKIGLDNENIKPFEELVLELGEIARIKNKKAIDISSFGIPSESEIRILSKDAIKTKSQLTEIWNKAQEIKKESIKTGKPYKTIEYRGTTAGVSKRTSEELTFGKGLYTTPNKEYAKEFGKVKEVKVNLKNPYVITNATESIRMMNPDNLQKLKDQGYDGIIERVPNTKYGNQTVQFEKPISIKTETPYKEVGSLTTKLLKKLEGKTTVNKQFISDLTNSPDLKQTEKDLIRAALKGEDSKINVTKFADKVKAELLPLKVKTNPNGTRYEDVSLESSLRGNVKNYSENIYQSPIKTSAGQIHFSDYSYDKPSAPNYFGHTRIEDMADNKTRRVIEVQSDLYQKGGLEKEGYRPRPGQTQTQMLQEMKDSKIYDAIKGSPLEKRTSEIAKLEQYNDPTAHFRMIREEIAQAAKDKKTKIQFPTGETAMKIEGLGTQDFWKVLDENGKYKTMRGGLREGSGVYLGTDAQPEVGMRILRGLNDEWIITDILGDGKFKAVPKDIYRKATDKVAERMRGNADPDFNFTIENVPGVVDKTETFDISGKVDTSNPIYKFYEKEMGKYLKSKYNAKEITDNQGVSWYEVDIKPEMKGPIEAFGIGAIPLATQINQDKK